VQDLLAFVIVAVVVVAGVAGLAAVALSRAPYEKIGRSDLTFDRDAAEADADAEIEQLRATLKRRRVG